MFLHISFHTYSFIQEDLGLCGPNNVDWIKRVLAQFALIYQSHFAKELYFVANLYFAADLYSTADRFPFHFFLWTFLALRSSWWVFESCFLLGFLPHRLLDIDL